MSPCAPVVVLLTLDEVVAHFSDAIQSRFNNSPMFDAGIRPLRMDAQGQGQGSLAAIRDAAFVLIRQHDAGPRRRSLTENAVIQHLSAAGRRQTVPVIEVVLDAKGNHAVDADPRLAQNPLFTRLLLSGDLGDVQAVVDQLQQALLPLVEEWPEPGQSSLLQICGLGLAQLDELDDANHWPQLARLFGCSRDLADDPRFAQGADATAVRWQQALALRSLSIGNRPGAIIHLKRLLALDDSHLIGNFWLSRLWSQTGTAEELPQALHRLHLVRGHLEPDEKLALSLVQVDQSRIYSRQEKHDAALAAAREACALDINDETLQRLMQELLAKLRRDGDIRLYHNDAIVNETVGYLLRFFELSALRYYRLMRQIDNEHHTELLAQIVQHVALQMQKRAVPLFKSEQEVTLLAAEALNQPLLAPRDPKPLMPWQQIEICRDTFANQLTLLQACADNLQQRDAQLESDEHHLAERELWATALPEHTESGHEALERAARGGRNGRYGALSTLVISLIPLVLSFTLLPQIRPYVGWWLGLAFITAVAFVLSWRKHRDTDTQTRAALQHEIEQLEQLLGEAPHAEVDLVNRLEMLTSQLREDNRRFRQQVSEQQQELLALIKRFSAATVQLEQCSPLFDGAVLRPIAQSYHLYHHSGGATDDTNLALLPDALARRLGGQISHGQALLRRGEHDHARCALFFDGIDDMARWQRLQAGDSSRSLGDRPAMLPLESVVALSDPV